MSVINGFLKDKTQWYKETKVATVVKGEAYLFDEIELLGEVDLGELGVWYYTDSIPNYHTGLCQMWFQKDYLRFD